MNQHALVTQTPLGELLLQKQLISIHQLQEALLEQQATNKRLGEILIRRKLLSFDQLDAILTEQLDSRIQANVEF